MNLNRLKLIIFDLDGTLVDSFPGIQIGLNRALEENGLPPKDLQWVRRNVGWGLRRLAVAAVGDDGPVDAVVDAFGRIYPDVLVDHSPPYPGVDHTLRLLAADYRIAVASNKPLMWVESLIDHLDWRSLMAAVVGPETAGAHKPDPAMVNEILRLTGCSSSVALLIGDMPVDAKTGRLAGVPVVGVTTGNASSDLLLDSGCMATLDMISDLPKWIQSGKISSQIGNEQRGLK